MADGWMQEMAEDKDRAVATEEVPTEPANSPPRTSCSGWTSAQPPPPPPRAQRHRVTEQWMQRNPQEADLCYRMEVETLEHDRSIQQWEAQMTVEHTQALLQQPNPTPTTVYTELQPRRAPDVRQDNDPARRLSSVTEVPLKKPPPSLERGMPKGFWSSADQHCHRLPRH